MKKTWNVPSIETLDVRMTESGEKPSEYEGGTFIIDQGEWQFIHETHPVS